MFCFWRKLDFPTQKDDCAPTHVKVPENKVSYMRVLALELKIGFFIDVIMTDPGV